MGQPLIRVALTVLDDGRPEYLRQTVESLYRHLPFEDFVVHILVNDSGDSAHAEYLQNQYPEFNRQVHHIERRGLMGAFLSAWSTALEYDWDFLWHNEDDILLLENLDLELMATLLTKYAHLAQIMLLRQAITMREFESGGVIQSALDDHTEYHDGDVTWTEHDRWFGFNPSLVKRSVVEIVVNNATAFTGANTYKGEQGVTDILRPAGYRYCYWGGINDAPRCHHIGAQHAEGHRL